MDWLKAYLRREARKIRALPDRRAKAEYIWQYYKLWIIGILSFLFLTGYLVLHRLTVPLDNWFYITFANTYAETGADSPLWRDFVHYSGFDPEEKNVYFNTNCYFDPASDAYNVYYTYFVAYVEAGTLDAITMERDDLIALGQRGRLLDLSRPEAARIAEKYADRFLYAVPLESLADTAAGLETPSGAGTVSDTAAQSVPIGIDLSDTPLVYEYHVYSNPCALGISANCPHMDAVERFLDYLAGKDTDHPIENDTEATEGNPS